MKRFHHMSVVYRNDIAKIYKIEPFSHGFDSPCFYAVVPRHTEEFLEDVQFFSSYHDAFVAAYSVSVL